MHLLDHVIVAVIALVVPAYAVFVAQPRMKREMLDATAGDRIGAYWLNVVFQWLLAGAVIAVWGTMGRPLAEMGFRTADPSWLAIAVVAILAIAGGLTLQYQLALRTPAGRAAAREQIRRTAPFMPRSPREMRHFSMAALTAGVCEEILYRGYLIWYITEIFGTDFSGSATAIIVSSLLFGLMHLYQGAKGVALVFVLSLVLATLYVLSRSIWLVIFLHAYVDLVGGLFTVSVFREGETAEGAAETTDPED